MVLMPNAVDTPRDAAGMVDHDAGWKLWTDMVRYYPSGVHRRRLVGEWLASLSERLRSHGLQILRGEAWGFPMMTAFKRAANLRPEQTMAGFGAGEWSAPKKLFGAALTRLFHLNVIKRGPQLLVLAGR